MTQQILTKIAIVCLLGALYYLLRYMQGRSPERMSANTVWCVLAALLFLALQVFHGGLTEASQSIRAVANPDQYHLIR